MFAVAAHRSAFSCGFIGNVVGLLRKGWPACFHSLLEGGGVWVGFLKSL